LPFKTKCFSKLADFAIGAFESGHVVVLRTMPVAELKLELTLPGVNESIKGTEKTLQLKFCVSYSALHNVSAAMDISIP